VSLNGIPAAIGVLFELWMSVGGDACGSNTDISAQTKRRAQGTVWIDTLASSDAELRKSLLYR
jgi:hypothetical protein